MRIVYQSILSLLVCQPLHSFVVAQDTFDCVADIDGSNIHSLKQDERADVELNSHSLPHLPRSLTTIVETQTVYRTSLQAQSTVYVTKTDISTTTTTTSTLDSLVERTTSATLSSTSMLLLGSGMSIPVSEQPNLFSTSAVSASSAPSTAQSGETLVTLPLLRTTLIFTARRPTESLFLPFPTSRLESIRSSLSLLRESRTAQTPTSVPSTVSSSASTLSKLTSSTTSSSVGLASSTVARPSSSRIFTSTTSASTSTSHVPKSSTVSSLKSSTTTSANPSSTSTSLLHQSNLSTSPISTSTPTPTSQKSSASSVTSPISSSSSSATSSTSTISSTSSTTNATIASATVAPPTSAEASTGSSNAVAIGVGVGVGVGVAVIILIFLLWFCCWRRRKDGEGYGRREGAEKGTALGGNRGPIMANALPHGEEDDIWPEYAPLQDLELAGIVGSVEPRRSVSPMYRSSSPLLTATTLSPQNRSFSRSARMAGAPSTHRLSQGPSMPQVPAFRYASASPEGMDRTPLEARKNPSLRVNAPRLSVIATGIPVHSRSLSSQYSTRPRNSDSNILGVPASTSPVLSISLPEGDTYWSDPDARGRTLQRPGVARARANSRFAEETTTPIFARYTEPNPFQDVQSSNPFNQSPSDEDYEDVTYDEVSAPRTFRHPARVLTTVSLMDQEPMTAGTMMTISSLSSSNNQTPSPRQNSRSLFPVPTAAARRQPVRGVWARDAGMPLTNLSSSSSVSDVEPVNQGRARSASVKWASALNTQRHGSRAGTTYPKSPAYPVQQTQQRQIDEALHQQQQQHGQPLRLSPFYSEEDEHADREDDELIPVVSSVMTGRWTEPEFAVNSDEARVSEDTEMSPEDVRNLARTLYASVNGSDRSLGRRKYVIDRWRSS